ncbi:hypothetical protein HNR63_002794 [Anoxybacillus kamchatkensis]|nr:hypothetical protein [Anoxybacillus ayderensis]
MTLKALFGHICIFADVVLECYQKMEYNTYMTDRQYGVEEGGKYGKF